MDNECPMADKVLRYSDESSRKLISDTMDKSGPFLVEVRFPRMGTSPDWYLCDSIEEFEKIIARASDQAEIYLNDVWDLTNPKGSILVKK